MESIEILYEQYFNLLEKIQESCYDNIPTNLLQYNITKNYYIQVDEAIASLKNFYAWNQISGMGLAAIQ